MTVNAMHMGVESFHRLVDLALQPGATTPTIPQPIVEWMAQLMLLQNVPFEYLVPHPMMLPLESIRFFVLDTNWLLRALEGAASAGVASSRDVVAMLTLMENAVQQIFAAAVSLRNQARGVAPLQSPTVSQTGWSGFLLRSCAVQYWPGMDVTATDQNSNPLQLLRIDRLSPNVLLCLFNGVAQQVSIMEPPETLHFGVFENASQPYVILRGLNAGEQSAGVPLKGDPQFNVLLRSSTSYPWTVMAQATANALTISLKKLGFLPPSGITSAEYAIEMVQSAGLQTFQRSGVL
jgi:hypothetical protein